MTGKQMYPLIDRMLELGMSEDLIEAVCSMIETREQYNKMLESLDQMVNPTRRDVLIKVLLITEPE